MDRLEEIFSKLGTDNAPGQEVQQDSSMIEKDLIFKGNNVDFSHGDVDAFKPIPGSLDLFIEGFHKGSKQAYTEYKGDYAIREEVARKLSKYTNAKIEADNQLIVTPGTQGALFLAIGSTVSRGVKVAIVEPDYFANRKLVEFFEGELVPIKMDYLNVDFSAGLNLNELESAFKSGVKVFIFSNPNNPTGVIYSKNEIHQIAKLAETYGVTVIVDELYSRQVFDERIFTHLCAEKEVSPDNLITIIGPSKTESLSGYRLGIAFGSAKIIQRMEKLQAIVSLRTSGYNQYVLKSWFSEPQDWMANRILDHQLIRDDLVTKMIESGKFNVRKTEAGSYLFPTILGLKVSIHEFVKALRLKVNVTVTPGIEFGPQFTRSFRINFSQDRDNALDAVDRIIKMIEIFENE